MKSALITGITGQDGSYLADLLVEKGYKVHGLVRPGATLRTQNIAHLLEPMQITLHYGDMIDSPSLCRVLEDAQPDEIYHLAAQAHVRVSFELPEYTAEVTALGTLRLLEAIRKVGLRCRFYQASSSELFGGAQIDDLDELSRFNPRSPYACAKAFAYYTAVNYREAYNLFVVNGILFNHESPRRSEHYVTRKVTLSAARIACGLQSELRLGNVAAERDWGYAPEYVEGMWRMLQAEMPDDYVLATGETHSVRELVENAFRRVDLDWQQYVRIDERFFRPTEVDRLKGDYHKAYERLGWEPKVRFSELVDRMVEADLERVARGA